MKPNGHDDAATSAVVVVDGVPLASAVGADVLKSQIAQLQQYQQAQAAAMRAQIYRQAEVASYQTQARAAQEDLVRCMKEGDHVGGAAATKSLTIACLHLIRLGVEYGLRWVFPKEEAPARDHLFQGGMRQPRLPLRKGDGPSGVPSHNDHPVVIRPKEESPGAANTEA